MKRWLWIVLALAGLTAAGSATAQIVINEVFYDGPSTDTNTWVELKGTPGMSLDGYAVVGVNGNGGVDYNTIALTGYAIPADGYFLICQNASDPGGADLVTNLVDYQNGPDSIQLRLGAAVIDAVGYQAHGPNDIFAGEGSPAPDQTPPNSLARCPDGFDSNENSTDFRLDPTPTPGIANDASCPQGQGACCLASGACVVVTRTECDTQGGNYLGDNTSCSPYPCPAQQVTLCQIAADDGNGVSLLEGRLVETEGIALTDGNTWSPTTQEFQITDGDCCIDVFGGTPNPLVRIGDRVRVIGTVQGFNGKTEITSPGLIVTILSNGNPLPPPAEITTFELSMNGEPYESCLFRINCVQIVGGDPWPADGVNANIVIDDGSGPVTMRIDRDTDIDGTPAPVTAFSVIGVGDQFDTSSPYTEGYQIKPRFVADIVYDCAAPTGACCFPDGTCQVATEEDCSGLAGSWQGEGTVCLPNPCQQPSAACCYENGVCEFLPYAACAGVWLGFGTDCEPNPCPQPEGACCFPDGSCTVTTQELCPTGDWRVGVPCQPNPCPPPLPEGACCYEDGLCVFTTEPNCPTGDWRVGVPCSPNPCPQPTGACCFVSGECQVLTREACAAAQGAYQGPAVPCDPNPCPVSPTERTTWGRVKNSYR